MNAIPSGCLDGDELRRLAHGEVSGNRLSDACEHLEVCARCRTRMESVESDPLMTALRETPDHRFEEEEGFKRSVKWLDSGSETAASSSEAARNGRIGRYRLTHRLARGGMSEVFQAFDPQLRRSVAVKLMRARDEGVESAQRFKRELEAIAGLDHPNVVKAFDAGP